jgi:hypothetical protein
MEDGCGLKRADIATGVFIVRSTMSNSDAPSRHRRKPGNDDADLHCRDAISIRVLLHASRMLASNGREAKSLLPDVFAPKEGGGAPNGAPRLPRLDAQARPRPDKRGRSPFGAPRRSCAGILFPTRPGPRFLESPDANGRTLSGTSAASTSQSGHAPDGLMPKPPEG